MVEDGRAFNRRRQLRAHASRIASTPELEREVRPFNWIFPRWLDL
jgi:hypothetical protein